MTGVWRWILLYVLALLVLQLVVYYYVQRGDDGGVAAPTASNGGAAEDASDWRDGWTGGPAANERTPGGEATDSAGTGPEADPHPPADEGSIRCPHCGALNDRESVFQFCRSCAGELGLR